MDLNKESSESQPHNTNANATDHLITTFIDITSATPHEALFFLESHNFDLDAAVSTFLESSAPSSAAALAAPAPAAAEAGDPLSPSPSPSPAESSRSASLSPSRSRSPSPSPASRSQYNLRSGRQQPGSGSASAPGRRVGGIRTLADLNRSGGEGSGSDSDRPPEYYTGGEKSGMLVQDPNKLNDVDEIFNQARQFGAMEGPGDVMQPASSSRSFRGRGRLLSGETAPTPQQQPPESITHTITFWRNGFTVDDGPLRMLDDPANASFLESITKSECPRELEPADRRTAVHVNLVRRDENCPEPEKRSIPFQGVGRTLGSSSDPLPSSSEPAAVATSMNSAPTPSIGLVVDPNLPTTSIQLRLADGTRLVSRFNHHHTIRDICAFIDASRPNGKGSYKLQTMGFPPKQLTDLDQTIEQAGLANSVIIQKF